MFTQEVCFSKKKNKQVGYSWDYVEHIKNVAAFWSDLMMWDAKVDGCIDSFTLRRGDIRRC